MFQVINQNGVEVGVFDTYEDAKKYADWIGCGAYVNANMNSTHRTRQHH